jgi:rubrerythrin
VPAILGPDHWRRVLGSGGSERALALPPGAADASPEVLAFLHQALFCEELGVEALMRRAAEAEGAATAECIRAHAEDEQGHVALLRALLGNDASFRPLLPIRLAAWLMKRDRGIPEHTVVSIVVEATGVAFYDLTAERLGVGRTAEVLRAIADEERVHLEFSRDLLAQLVPGLPAARIRSLRRLRGRLVMALLLGHLADHWRILGPASRVSARTARRRMLAEIERGFSRVPLLAVAV